MRVDHRDVGVAGERDVADQAVEEQARERVDVRPRVDLGALDLLGRDVVDRADDVAGLELDVEVDPSLLGGLVVRVGARLYDTSLKSRLQRLQYAMKGAA